MHLPNTLPAHGAPLHPADAAAHGPEGTALAARFTALRDGAAPTPLHALPGLAARLGVGALHVKDEGQRLGLGSFKALGGAYALMRLVQEQAETRLGRPVAPEELRSPEVRAVAAGMTFACATDGNHGRSVAQGARDMGARATIFLHAGVSAAREAAIAAFGARIIRTAGGYDDSVAEAARIAAREGWTVLSDTSWDGYERIPALVAQGYTLIAAEALDALPAPPTHVFLQAGVGGFAAAMAAAMALRLGAARPHVVIVEPSRAACIMASAQAGRPTAAHAGEATVMAMLECHAPSPIAWRVLERVADGFMTVEEDDALATMRALADPVPGDPAIVAGESGGAGLAGLMRAAADPRIAARMGLGPGSRALAVNTEGATDPALYARLVGRDPAAVLEGAAA